MRKLIRHGILERTSVPENGVSILPNFCLISLVTTLTKFETLIQVNPDINRLQKNTLHHTNGSSATEDTINNLSSNSGRTCDNWPGCFRIIFAYQRDPRYYPNKKDVAFVAIN